MAFQLIAASEADDFLQQPEYIIIDLRSYVEYRQGHLKGALNLPFELLEQYIKKLPAGRKYLLYCNHGAASMMAGRKISNEGLDVLSISGGILSYRGRLFV